jgi:hypothetical protein
MPSKFRLACPTFGCKHCVYVDTSGKITCNTTGETFETKTNGHFHSSNLIYVISCKICGKHYVGQTNRKLFKCLQEHLRSIKIAQDAHLNFCNRPIGQNPNPVGLHLAQPGHNGIAKMSKYRCWTSSIYTLTLKEQKQLDSGWRKHEYTH